MCLRKIDKSQGSPFSGRLVNGNTCSLHGQVMARESAWIWARMSHWGQLYVDIVCLQLGDGLHLVTMWTVTAQGTGFSPPKWSCRLWFPHQNSSKDRIWDRLFASLTMGRNGDHLPPEPLDSPSNVNTHFHRCHTPLKKIKCQREWKTA